MEPTNHPPDARADPAPSHRGPPRAGRLRVLVVGIDGTAAGVAALRWAVDVAHGADSRVLAVAAVAPQPVLPGAGVADAMVAEAVMDERQLRAEAEAWLADAVGAVPIPPGLAVEWRAVLGDPATALIEAAQDADLLVVGNHRHGALASAFTGSVAQSCARLAPCPLVLVPEPAPE